MREKGPASSALKTMTQTLDAHTTPSNAEGATISATLPITFVETLPALKALCASLKAQAKNDPNFFITMDTEFIRRNTYFPQLSVIQIGAPGQAYVVDFIALKGKHLTPLIDLLRSPLILKVFHSAAQDCEALYHALGRFPFPLFDTQIAAAALGLGGCVGYEPLVRELLGIHVDKTCQQSPWLDRPLTQEQITYAAYDVIYLINVYRVLRHRLKKTQRTSWVASESLQLLDQAIYEIDATTLWQKFPSLPKQWKEAFIMKYLLAWRETKAIELDRPRPHIVRDQVLFELAFDSHLFQKPARDLLTHPRFKPSHSPFFSVGFWEKHGLFTSLDRLLSQIQQRLTTLKPEEIADFREEIRLSSSNTHNRKPTWHEGRVQLKKICRRCAEQNNVAPSLFFGRHDIDAFFEGIFRTHNPWLTSSRLSRGWRKALLKPYQPDLEKVIQRFILPSESADSE